MSLYTFFLLVSYLLTFAVASVPSYGDSSIASYRNELSPEDYVINLEDEVILRTPEYVVRQANFSNFPILGGRDVQMHMVKVFLNPSATLFSHYHPRSSEMFMVKQGTFRVEIFLEFPLTEPVTNTLTTKDATVFPQGLGHRITCISERRCGFISVFTSADPGIITFGPSTDWERRRSSWRYYVGVLSCFGLPRTEQCRTVNRYKFLLNPSLNWLEFDWLWTGTSGEAIYARAVWHISNHALAILVIYRNMFWFGVVDIFTLFHGSIIACIGALQPFNSQIYIENWGEHLYSQRLEIAPKWRG